MPFPPSANLTPLRKIRRDSSLSLRQILVDGQKITDDFPKSVAGLSQIEKRGTRNHDLLCAFALIYKRPFDDIKAAATPTKKR